MIELALIGHGSIDEGHLFNLPPNCYVVVYTPDNYGLTNSAIQEISESRYASAIKSKKDLVAYIDALNRRLDGDRNAAKLFEPGDLAPMHFLQQLPGNQGVGSTEQKRQFSKAVAVLQSVPVLVMDADSLKSKPQIGVMGESVSLERVLHYYQNSQRPLVLHWIACRRVENTKALGYIRCQKHSLTQGRFFTSQTNTSTHNASQGPEKKGAPFAKKKISKTHKASLKNSHLHEGSASRATQKKSG